MFKFLIENFKRTNDCIILATPMVLFFIALQWYIESNQYSLSSISSYVFFYITLWVFISGCFAGWFYMVKKTLQFSKKTFLFDTDRLTALSKLFSCLIKGIGKFFLPILVVVASCFAFNIIKMILLFFAYTDKLKDQYYLISVISIFIVYVIGYFFIFWIPEIVYTYKNSFVSLIESVKKAIIIFPKLIIPYIIVSIIVAVINFLLSNSQTYPFLYFFLLLSAYYFLLYSVILVFSYYERNFVEEN